jgi:hypothetical protein
VLLLLVVVFDAAGVRPQIPVPQISGFVTRETDLLKPLVLAGAGGILNPLGPLTKGNFGNPPRVRQYCVSWDPTGIEKKLLKPQCFHIDKPDVDVFHCNHLGIPQLGSSDLLARWITDNSGFVATARSEFLRAHLPAAGEKNSE